MPESATSSPSSPGSLREAVLAGPGVGVGTGAGVGPLGVVATPEAMRAAAAAAGHADARRADLSAEVTAVLVLGLCLYGEDYDAVIGRLWPYLGAFNPALALRCGPVTAAALSQARGRLPAGVVREVFEAGARADPTPATAPTGGGPAPERRRNGKPNTPATSATRSTSPSRTCPKRPNRPSF